MLRIMTLLNWMSLGIFSPDDLAFQIIWFKKKDSDGIH